MAKLTLVNGNIKSLSKSHRGWFMGHFMEGNSPFKTDNVEIKWGDHKKGDKKSSEGKNLTARTLAILVRGKMTYSFDNNEIQLTKEGDYIFWPSGTAHTWTADEDCLTLTIRWPSIPNDQVTHQL